MSAQVVERDPLERARMGRLEHHRRRDARFERLDPPIGAHAPLVVGLQAREAERGLRRRQVVARPLAERVESSRSRARTRRGRRHLRRRCHSTRCGRSRSVDPASTARARLRARCAPLRPPRSRDTSRRSASPTAPTAVRRRPRCGRASSDARRSRRFRSSRESHWARSTRPRRHKDWSPRRGWATRPAAASCDMPGRRIGSSMRLVPALASFPMFGPVLCRFVRVEPGCAASLRMPQRSRALRRCSSDTKRRFASFDSEYAFQARYPCSRFRSSKLMAPIRCAPLLTVTTRGAGPRGAGEATARSTQSGRGGWCRAAARSRLRWCGASAPP